MNGVIWSKMQGTFVPISSVPAYAVMQQERFRQSRALETHNFQLQNLTLTSFQEPNFLEFYDNDTKVSGLCGELWNLLSELLNFKLQPVRANVDGLGTREVNFQNGLLGVIFRNETIAIPKVEMYSGRLLAADFTMPLWINKNRLYIRHETIYDNTWMVKVFSWQLWCTMLITHLLLNLCSFWLQSFLAWIRGERKSVLFGEHFFYNFGLLCNQSYISKLSDGRSKILQLSLNLFSYVMYLAFGAMLFTYITKRVFIPPFNDLESLVTKTKYNVITLKGSLGDIAFQVGDMPPFLLTRTAKRNVAALTIEKMFQMACSSTKKKYAIFQGEDEYMTRKQTICRLSPVGQSYLNIWISSAIAKNFKHKRTIDLGILKLKEAGLWDALMERWLKPKIEEISNKPEAIGMDQVSLVITMICCGIVMALIILIIENIVFVYKIKQS